MGDFNPDMIELLEEADVYYHLYDDTVTAPANVTSDWAAGWKMFGSLGTDGITESFTNSMTKFYDLNGRQIKTGRRESAVTVGLTILQYDEDTIPIIRPGSTETSIKSGVKPPKIILGLEFREGLRVSRLVSANFAEIDVTGDVKHGSDAPTGYPAMATIYPLADKTVWNRIAGELPSS